MTASGARGVGPALLVLVGCYAGVSGVDPADYVRRIGTEEANEMAARWERDVQEGNSAVHQQLDWIGFCVFAGCHDFASALLVPTEEAVRDEYTTSVAGEIGAAVVSERLRQYRTGPTEYGALRLYGLLLHPGPSEVAVQSRRIAFDAQQREGRLDSLGVEGLTPAAAIAARALPADEADLAEALARLAEVYGREGIRAFLSQDTVGKVPFLILVDLVPPLEESNRIFGWVDETGEINAINIATPSLPGSDPAGKACELRVQGTPIQAPLIADFGATFHRELDQRLRSVVARAVSRSIGKAIAADQIGDQVSPGRGGALGRSLINIALAATEKADLRSPRMVPRAVYAAMIPRGATGPLSIQCPHPFRTRQFPSAIRSAEGVSAAFSVRTLWGISKAGTIRSESSDVGEGR